jgi:hypothetical protein
MCGIGIQEKILELKTKQKTVIDSIKLYVKSKEWIEKYLTNDTCCWQMNQKLKKNTK